MNLNFFSLHILFGSTIEQKCIIPSNTDNNHSRIQVIQLLLFIIIRQTVKTYKKANINLSIIFFLFGIFVFYNHLPFALQALSYQALPFHIIFLVISNSWSFLKPFCILQISDIFTCTRLLDLSNCWILDQVRKKVFAEKAKKQIWFE